jgi:hypothetical protein
MSMLPGSADAPQAAPGPGGHRKGKSKVDRVVQCVLSNVFAGEEFVDLADAVSGAKIASILDVNKDAAVALAPGIKVVSKPSDPR